MRTFNLADLFEATADAIPERPAVVAGPVRRSYAELDRRATQLANHLLNCGVAPGDHVGVLSANRIEWIEALLGILKARAAPLNLNYRYTAGELGYVLNDADAVALVTEASLLPVVAEALPHLPLLRHVVVLGDALGEPAALAAPLTDLAAEVASYEEALSTARLERPGPRSGDDRFLLYTGGTTGRPKGVVWRSEDLFFAALQGGNPGGSPVETPEGIVEVLAHEPQPWLVTSPLMHGNGQWNSLVPLLTGRGVVLWTGRRFDADAVAGLAAREAARLLVLVGDGMALPFVDALEAADPAPDLSALRVIASGGAMLSPRVTRRLLAQLPRCRVVDGFGASELGSSGQLVSRGDQQGPPRFTMDVRTAVLDDELRPVPTGAVGRLARCGPVPLGYWKDEASTAATFPTDADGVRWAVPGDLARPEKDGTVTLLGRGSSSINTGGEKVHPEEVATATKEHPDVVDAIVVGVPDERFGQQVAAVVAPRPGTSVDVDVLRAHLRPRLADYKAPRQVVLVDELRYTPQGKPDLRWAADLAAREDT